MPIGLQPCRLQLSCPQYNPYSQNRQKKKIRKNKATEAQSHGGERRGKRVIGDKGSLLLPKP
jgi:hypothetical protein